MDHYAGIDVSLESSSVCASRPLHPASRFVTIGRNAPLHRGGMGQAYKSDLPDGLSEIFFARGLDRNSRTPPVGQITW